MSCFALFLAFLQLHQYSNCCNPAQGTNGWYIDSNETLVTTWVSNEYYRHIFILNNKVTETHCEDNGKTWYLHDEYIMVDRGKSLETKSAPFYPSGRSRERWEK